MKITNRDVIQSYIVTTARYDFSILEKRILYMLIEACQFELNGKKLDSRIIISNTLWGMREISIPVSKILNGEDDNNHARVKEAIRRLNEKKFEYEDDKIWKIIRIVEVPKIEKYKEYVSFQVHPEIYQAILNFSKGYRKFELKTAMMFKSVYAMRFYELLSGKTTPIKYSVEHLKIMFGVENKYKKINDFAKRIIEPAKKELDEKSPYSFTYETYPLGTRKIEGYMFYPVFIPKNRDEELLKKTLQKQISPRWELDKMIVDYLKQNYAFDTKGIQQNIDLLVAASRKIDLMVFLANIRRKAQDAKKPQGYLINAIKKQLEQIKS